MKSKIKLIVIAGALSLLASAPAFADAVNCPGGATHSGCATVPEPGSLPLIILGVVAVGIASRFFKKK
jgi:hypothetical protein